MSGGWRAVQNNIKPLAPLLGKRDPQVFTCHAWMPDEKERCVVGTDVGDLLLVDGGELRCSLASPGEGVGVHSIVPYSKGFIVGCDQGMLSLYEKTEDKEFYRLVKSFTIEGHANKIVSLAVQPSEETLLSSLDSSQLFSLVLSNVEIMKPEEMNFELLLQDFHSQGITGLDCCIRKPLVATCSMDMSVRIWNYQDKHLEQMKYFPEEAYSIAFHPSGLHILVGVSNPLP